MSARNRSARLAVLASSLQRPAVTPYPSRASSAVKRRVAAGVLVLLSLVLITVYFRESDEGPLHDLQGTGASILRPFEIAADRIASPFQDAYGYFSDLVNAKSEADRWREEAVRWRQLATQNQAAVQQNEELREALQLRGTAPYPRGYELVTAEVTAQPPSPYDQQLSIGAGLNQGVRRDSAVVDPEGNFVGTVSVVYKNVSRVTLLTDQQSGVSAYDLRTRAGGILRHAEGTGDLLFLDRVSKQKQVTAGDQIVTAGWKAGSLASLYPRNIPVGYVSDVNQLDIDPYKRVQVTPYADFSSLETVVVLVNPRTRSPLP
jgi:rod shape-determining protein MreC